jgi:hypothetical protein
MTIIIALRTNVSGCPKSITNDEIIPMTVIDMPIIKVAIENALLRSNSDGNWFVKPPYT